MGALIFSEFTFVAAKKSQRFIFRILPLKSESR